MSKGQTLRDLVNERLAAAAEEIFVLFERTIAEYEEELCRSREENQRKQLLLDTVLSQKTELVRENIQIPSGAFSGLQQEITETSQIKEESEEQSVQQEEQQLPVPVFESIDAGVKTEESSQLQQTQSEIRDKIKDEDINSEPHLLSEMEEYADNDNWGPLLSYSATLMETETDGDSNNQVEIRDRISTLSPQNQPASEISVHIEDIPEADGAEERLKCPFCTRTFGRSDYLQRHIKVHTGETPYGCSMCDKIFSQKCNLVKHKRIHTGEKPYCCPICKKTFSDPSVFTRHKRMHTGEKPYSCTICERKFTRKDHLKTHMSNTHRM